MIRRPRCTRAAPAGGGVVLKALRPIGGTEFIVAPRQLPPVKEVEVRVDSSLRGDSLTSNFQV